VNSLPKTVTRQRRGCDLNPGPSARESSTLTTRLPSHLLVNKLIANKQTNKQTRKLEKSILSMHRWPRHILRPRASQQSASPLPRTTHDVAAPPNPLISICRAAAAVCTCVGGDMIGVWIHDRDTCSIRRNTRISGVVDIRVIRVRLIP